LANAVAPLPDGAAVTSFGSPDDPKLANLIAGRPSGFVMVWSKRTGWVHLKGSHLPGDNGIESSADGKTLYVAAWTDHALWILSRDGRRAPTRVPLGNFHPDNIHWQHDGTLLIAGEVGDASAILSCGPHKICSTPSMLVVFNPARGGIAAQQFIPPTTHFGAASTAIRYQDRYWLGSFLGDRIVEVQVAPAANKHGYEAR
jgi:sugar lactone lactonase YvrE